MFETAMFLELMEKFTKKCYENSKAKGFWDGLEMANIPTKIALMHSELSEMLEAFRRGNPPTDKPVTVIDPKCPEGVRKLTGIEEEAADVLIRLCDLCGRLEIDLARVAIAKMNYNSTRPMKHGGMRV